MDSRVPPIRIRSVFGIAFLIFVIWLGTGLFLPILVQGYYPPVSSTATDSSVARLGQIGDMFGAANALLSGLAIIAAIVAVVLQSRELEASTRELANTSAANAKIAELQAEAVRVQAMLYMLDKINLDEIRKITESTAIEYIANGNPSFYMSIPEVTDFLARYSRIMSVLEHAALLEMRKVFDDATVHSLVSHEFAQVVRRIHAKLLQDRIPGVPAALAIFSNIMIRLGDPEFLKGLARAEDALAAAMHPQPRETT